MAAMGSMSSVLSQTITQALSALPTGVPSQLPSAAPQPTSIDPPVAQGTVTGAHPATPETVLSSRKRALSRRAERARTWKCARAQSPDLSVSDGVSDEEALADFDYGVEEDLTLPVPVPSTSAAAASSAKDLAATSTATRAEGVLDEAGELMFDPESLHHPRSAEWLPSPHVGAYLEHWVRHSLSRESRNKLRAECPRPVVPNKVCDTPLVDPKMSQFLAKTGWNAKKGLDSALRSCQDKLLDVFGPLTRILEMAEAARIEGSPVDPVELRGWAQRAICLAGNANTAVAIERRKAILFKIDPKLANLALTEAGKDAQGLLFGESFIKDMGRFVGTFTALDKAQASMRRVFQGRVSHRAGSGRGRLSGRANFQARGANRGSSGHRPQFQDQRTASPFFSTRGNQWRSRSFRGNPNHRRPLGKCSPDGGFYGTLCRGKTPAFFPRLEPHYRGPMGSDHGQGIPHRALGIPLSDSFPSALSPIALGRCVGGCRIARPQAEVGDRAGSPVFGGGDQQYLSGSEEGWADETSHQPSLLECGSTLPALQNGRDPPPSGFIDPGGLDGETRLEGCLPDGSGVLSLQGPASVQVARRGLEVHLSAVRAVFSSLVFHQVAASGRVVVEDSGCASHNLSGRHPVDARVPSGIAGASTLDGGSAFGSRVPPQPGEILPYSGPEDGVPGIYCGFALGVPQPAGGEVAGDPQGVETCSPRSPSLVTSPGPHYRPVGLFHSGGVPSPSALPGSPATEDRPSSDRCLLCGRGGSGLGSPGGTELVDSQPGSVERESNLWIPAGVDDRIGREPPGLGGPLQRGLHRWSLVDGGIPPTHQCVGALGGVLRCEEFLQRNRQRVYPASDGQRVGGPVCQPSRGHSLGHLGAFGQRFLVVLPVQGYHGAGGIFARIEQRSGGLELSLPVGRQRLAVGSAGVHGDFGFLGSNVHRPLRLSAQQAADPVLQLASGPGSDGGGCFPPGLVDVSPVRVSSVLNDPEDSPAGSPPSGGSGSGGPVLGIPGLVPLFVEDSGRDSCSSPEPAGSSTQPSGSTSSPPPRRIPATTGVPDLRTPGSFEGISAATQRLLDNAWAPGTRKSYRAAWRTWANWCVERDLDPVSAPVADLLLFLTSLFEAGKAYRTINLFRSAISSTHEGYAGVAAGQHPSVSRLLRGARLSRPPRPRFSTTWDVSLVLGFLASWPENSALSIRQLSAKLLALFCLISCKRVSDVRALDYDARSFTPEGVTFNISRRTKTSIRFVSYPSFPTSPILCPVACLREYESRTLAHRSPTRPQLFVSIRHPFGPVASPTLARWLKWVMSLAGVDTSVFTAHSARGASATALAVSGARLEDVMRLADWSNVTTFREFYFRPPAHLFASIIDRL
ncbi:uncharacterized protein LOC122921396 [Bufo gargarizans]|uniref:uncharacterized protein LOC122921396 n=1 Tax=Bufo gargarizans TaxID=30331 RepID=UPI001CF47E57|nr:uncharacterized protein LOC122921396 [Bufo gargarizans]